TGTNRDDEILAMADAAARGNDPLPTASETADVDHDLIHIPFLRLSALGRYDELARLANEYVTAYPGSAIGYLYLAEAEWRSGNQAGALNVLREGVGAGAGDQLALSLLRQAQQPPIERLARTAID
ncbi:MAG TPA: hypothetical protein VFV50_13610, partial [Bdellovibrionales bacterium]|nr:hypothetical protein [Bdellovibrionales bacterium]